MERMNMNLYVIKLRMGYGEYILGYIAQDETIAIEMTNQFADNNHLPVFDLKIISILALPDAYNDQNRLVFYGGYVE